MSYGLVYGLSEYGLAKQLRMSNAEAKQLMEAAGMAGGFKTTLTTEKYLEIPDYAVLIQNAVIVHLQMN